MKPTIALFASLVFLNAYAGEFHETGGVALKGHDPVAYFTEGRPVKGEPQLRYEHKGTTFVFASAANRDAFAANAVKYAPQYGGYCAFGVSRGYKADIDPAAFSIVNGKLYVNYSAQVRADWLKDPSGYIHQADARWPDVRLIEKIIR